MRKLNPEAAGVLKGEEDAVGQEQKVQRN
jgi:hypothetical protein